MFWVTFSVTLMILAVGSSLDNIERLAVLLTGAFLVNFTAVWIGVGFLNGWW